MRFQLLLVPTLLALLVLPVLLLSCGEPEDDDPFDRGVDRDDDDDDDTPEWDAANRTAFIQMQRSNAFGETGANVEVTATFFPPTPMIVRTPVPEELDTCNSGIDHPDVFEVPAGQWDAGVFTLELLDGEAIDLEWNEGASRYERNLSSSAWTGEQEYTIRWTGGDDVPEAEHVGILGTPASLMMDEFNPNLDDGFFLTWVGGNNNGHVELRLTSDPIDEGEKEAQVIWIACKLRDDNQHVIDWDYLQPMNGQGATLELLRGRTTTFDTSPDQPGDVQGASVVINLFEFPQMGDDDDDAVDDDDAHDDDDSVDDDDSSH